MTSRTSETRCQILWVRQKALAGPKAQEEYDALSDTLHKTKLQCHLTRALNRERRIGIQMPTSTRRTLLMTWHLLTRGYMVRRVEIRSARHTNTQSSH